MRSVPAAGQARQQPPTAASSTGERAHVLVDPFR